MLVALLSTYFMALMLGRASADDFENLNNMAVANNALSLSYLSSTFFECHLDPVPGFGLVDCEARISPQPVRFSMDDFIAAGYNESVFNAVNEIAYQQYAQVDRILGLVSQIGGDDYVVIPACNYTFSNTTTLEEYLSNGLKLTHQLLGFYNGATYSIGNSSALQSSAQMFATSQAHHAAYLSLLLDLPVSPNSGMDNALTIGSIAGAASPYLRQCRTPPFTAQTVRPYGVSYGGRGVTTYTGPRAQAAGTVYSEANRQTDLEILNFLFGLESMQRAMYLNVTSTLFSTQALAAAGYNAGFVRPLLSKFMTEGAGHINMLRQQVVRLNGATDDCDYEFGLWLPHTQFAMGMSYSISSVMLWSYEVLAGLVVDTQIQRQLAIMSTVVARHNTVLAMLSNGYTAWAFDGEQQAGLPDNFGSMVPIETIEEIIENGLHISSSGACDGTGFISSSSSTGTVLPRLSSSSSSLSSSSPPNVGTGSSNIPTESDSSSAQGGDRGSSSSGVGGPGDVNDALSTPSNAALLWTFVFSAIVVMLW